MNVSRTMRQFGYLLAGVPLIIAVFFAGVYVGSHSLTTAAQNALVEQANPNTIPPANADEDFAAFWQVYNLIKKNYIDSTDDTDLVNGAIDGMIGALNDQFSGYISPELFGIMDDLSGEIQGIGVVISLNETTNLIEVTNVLRGTPAEAAGLREGDIFLEVNGEDVRGINTSELAARVRGPEGTIVNLKMLRGDQELEFSIPRARIVIPNVETDVLEGNIGYIKLNQFTVEARRDLDRAMAEIDANNLNGVIIDLRGNPGGLLSSAVNVASAFIERGVILYEQFGDGTEQIFEANGTYLGYNKPLVVLVDERSASGSELVAGAWQDQGVATLIGTQTFGKGTVQTQSPLVNGGGVRLTIARWLTPNRNWIHNQGIQPDIVVEWLAADRAENPDDDPQLKAALEFFGVGAPAGE